MNEEIKIALRLFFQAELTSMGEDIAYNFDVEEDFARKITAICEQMYDLGYKHGVDIQIFPKPEAYIKFSNTIKASEETSLY